MVTINGDWPPVSPDDLVKPLGIAHGIQISDLLVEVCLPPTDFFVRFRTTFDCSRVFESSWRLFCDGALVSFDRWHPVWGSVPSELEFLTKLTFHGMPRHAWNSESINKLINWARKYVCSSGQLGSDGYGMDEEAVHHTEGDWS